MIEEKNKVGFDLSVLSLKELIEVSNNIHEFLKYLEEKKVNETNE